jgi:hypothetical protein
MGFRFEIMSVSKLPRACIGVLDGRLVDGSVVAGMTAELIHDGERLPIHIKGLVLGSVSPGADVLSLTVDLRQEAVGLASIGDLIVSTS